MGLLHASHDILIPRIKRDFPLQRRHKSFKAYGLIQRFSEDIDLILDWRMLGFSDDEPWQNRSSTAQVKFNKNANEKAALYIESEILPVLKSSIEKELGHDADITIDEADPQTIVFRYPNIYESAYLSPSIRLEIGPVCMDSDREEGDKAIHSRGLSRHFSRLINQCGYGASRKDLLGEGHCTTS